MRDYPFEPFAGELPGELLRMVQERPVSRVRLPDGRPAWLVVGYDETCTVLADPRFSRRENPEPGPGCPRDLGMNGAAHASLRRLAARAFTARHVDRYRPRVQTITDSLLDDMERAGPPADLMSALVAPLPALVVCDVLGVPASDRPLVDAWAYRLFGIAGHGDDDVARASAELHEHLRRRVDERRDQPGEDLLTTWLAAERAGELTAEEVVGLAVGVLLGGREINSTAVGIRTLLQHPDALAELRADPARLPGAVEEILRHTSVSPMFLVQTALADVELGGHRIAAGDAVMAVPWAANRAEAAFADADVFDIHRTPNPHLTFGYGPHFCLGAALGRLQMEIAIGSLLVRFPGLAPAVPLAEIEWRTERMNCGMLEFPVTWGLPRDRVRGYSPHPAELGP